MYQIPCKWTPHTYWGTPFLWLKVWNHFWLMFFKMVWKESFSRIIYDLWFFTCMYASMHACECVCVCVWLLWGHCRVTQAGRRKLPVNPNLFLFFLVADDRSDWTGSCTPPTKGVKTCMFLWWCLFPAFFLFFFFFNITVHIISDNVCFCFNHLVCFL